MVVTGIRNEVELLAYSLSRGDVGVAASESRCVECGIRVPTDVVGWCRKCWRKLYPPEGAEYEMGSD